MSAQPGTLFRICTHAARRGVAGILHRPVALALAAAAGLVVGWVELLLLTHGGMAGGIVYALVRAAGVSLLLFAGRAVIERSPLGIDDLGRGSFAFFNDLLSVFFVLWLAEWLFGALGLGWLPLLAVLVLPVFETVAFTPVGGYGVFEAAWRFFRRDAGAWLLGQLPLIPVLFVGWTFGSIVTGLLAATAGSEALRVTVSALTWVLMLVGFVYRGYLFEIFNTMSPRRREERFGAR